MQYEFNQAAFDQLAPDQRRAALRHLRDMEQGHRSNPLWRFDPMDPNGTGVPHWKQHRWLLAHKTPEGRVVKVRVFLGGNRSGKSLSGVVADILECVDRAIVPPHLQQYKRWDEPVQIWVVSVTSNASENTTIPYFREWTPSSQLVGGQWARAFSKEQKRLHFKNGSVVQFMTQGMDQQAFKGAKLHRCLDDQSRVLTRGGWASSVDIGEEILTYDTATAGYAWRPVRGVFRGREARMVRLRSRNNFEALVTADHRWWVRNKKTGESYFTTTDQLKTSEQILVAGGAVDDADEAPYSDAEIALVGWVITDGWVQKSNITIAQSASANGAKCAAIATLLDGLPHSTRDVPYRKGEGTMRHFALKGDLRRRIMDVVGVEKNLPQPFVTALSRRQREILLAAIIDGDGCRNYDSGRWSVTSGNEQHHEAILALATLLGWRVSISATQHGWSMIYAKSREGRYDYRRVSVDALEIDEVDYDGEIWCPSTDAGTVVVERCGAVFVTGNCHFDEEPLYDHGRGLFSESLARIIDTNGDVLLTMTPQDGFTWVGDDIYEPWQQQNDGAQESFAVLAGTVPIYVSTVSGSENPTVDDESRQASLALASSDEEREAREHGRFVTFSGLVYPQWNPERHVVPEQDALGAAKGARMMIVGLDPGFRHMAAAVWVALTDDDHVWVVAELAEQETVVSEVAKKVLGVTTDKGFRPDAYIADPAILKRDSQTGISDQQAFAQAGLAAAAGQNDVRPGVNRIRHLLKGDRLHVAASCTELIWELKRYRWVTPKRSEHATREVPVKKDDHALDAFRYAVMALPIDDPSSEPDNRSKVQRLFDAERARMASRPASDYARIG